MLCFVELTLLAWLTRLWAQQQLNLLSLRFLGIKVDRSLKFGIFQNSCVLASSCVCWLESTKHDSKMVFVEGSGINGMNYRVKVCGIKFVWCLQADYKFLASLGFTSLAKTKTLYTVTFNTLYYNNISMMMIIMLLKVL